MKIGIIGAGKVGVSLGKLLAQRGVPVVGFYSRTPDSAEQAAVFTKTARFATLEELITACDTLFVTTSDGVIADVWGRMKTLPVKSKMICHCSGALPSSVFEGAEALGAQTCSVHPMMAVSDRFTSWEQLGQAFFTLEGSGSPRMQALLHDCGVETAVIRAEDKARYHLASCVVSNLAVGLSQWGIDLLEGCGFTAEQARRALTPLMLGNMQAVCEKGPKQALTGPAERGDMRTIQSHIACLGHDDAVLYALLTRRLCDLAQEKHPDRNDTALRTYLEGIL